VTQPVPVRSVRSFRLSTWAVEHPLPVILLFVALTVAGLIAFATLPVKRYPDINFPAVAITVTQPGTAAGELESAVTRPIEQAVAGLPRVEIIVSTAVQGVSTTVVQFDLGQDLREATDKVRAQVDQARSRLPTGIDPPIVRQVEIEDIPILSYAVVSTRQPIGALSTLIDDDVVTAIQRMPGVSKVTRIGGVAREINVIADPARLTAMGLTIAQLNDALRRFNRDDPAGLAQVGGREQAMRVFNAAVGVDDLRAMTIPTGSGRTVPRRRAASRG
jgi:HAE1 family hydrophobic/amphiphilic exporter-1